MPDKDEPVVVSSFKRDDGPAPVYVAEGKEAEFEPVILKYDVEKKEEKKGFYVDIKDIQLTSVALMNMAEEIKNYLKNEGISLKEDDLKVFVSSLTSRLILIDDSEFKDYVFKISEYFSKNVFYAKSVNDSSILKCCYSACRNPLVCHFLLWDLKPNMPLPEYLVRYILLPSSGVEMIMNEYINDTYIGKAKLTDNIFIIVRGNKEYLDSRLDGQYALWNPRMKRVEKENAPYKVISMNSFKNMHKVMDPISDELWSKMNTIEEVLASMSFKLENKDCNHLDDFLVTLVNQGLDDNRALEYLLEYRLFPMVSKRIDLEEFKRRLNEVAIYQRGRA